MKKKTKQIRTAKDLLEWRKEYLKDPKNWFLVDLKKIMKKVKWKIKT